MDEFDRINLNFLLSVDEQTFSEFLDESDDDDIEYAIELIQTYKAQLMTQELELEEAVDEEHGLDLSDAQNLLARFRL